MPEMQRQEPAAARARQDKAAALRLTNLLGVGAARSGLVRARFFASIAAGLGSAVWYASLGLSGAAEPAIAWSAAGTVVAFYALFVLLSLTPLPQRLPDRGLQTTQLVCASATVLGYSHFLAPDVRLASLFWLGGAFAFASHHHDLDRLQMRAAGLTFASGVATLAYAWAHPAAAGAAWLGWVALSAFIVLLANIAGMIGGYRRKTYHSRAVAEVALASIKDAVLILDPERRILSVNEAATQLLGRDGDALCGLRFEQAVPMEPFGQAPVNPVRSAARDADGADGGGRAGSEVRPFRLVLAAGREVEIECVRAPLRTPTGVDLGEVVLLRDVGATNRLMRKLEHESRHDALTGLLNRSGFLQQIHRRFEQAGDAARAGTPHLLVIDLDEFKLVNDSCGHGAGDQLLCEIASVIRARAGSEALVARLGGDEFAVLYPDVSDAQGRALAKGLLADVDRYRFYRDQQVFRVRASAGLAPVPMQETDLALAVDKAMGNADAACYLAKELGRNRLHAFTSGDDELARKRRDMSWVQEIRLALEQDRFVLMGQRISSTAALAAAAPSDARAADPAESSEVEVLLRMIDREGNLVAPGAFLPAAERFGLMKDIDRYVVRESVAMLARARAAGALGLRLSINLSAASLQDDELPQHVGAELARQGVPGSAVCFEITETAAITNLVSARTIIAALRAHGCQMALDDVGTGFSSFGYLKALDVDRLKIDGSFVKAVGDEPVDRIMVESLYRIARAVGIETVAEMVESPRLIEQISAIGIDYLQGFAIHRPEPLDGLLGLSRLPGVADGQQGGRTDAVARAAAARSDAAVAEIGLLV